LLLDHDGYLPSYAVITDGKKGDITVARTMKFAAGTVLVMDRGYNDYDWFEELTDQGVFFVTRMKDNADYDVVEKRKTPEKSSVVSDEVIFSTVWPKPTNCVSSAASKFGMKTDREHWCF
jgi:hypothetical protein